MQNTNKALETMITSREDYEFYLEADKIALGIEETEKATLKNKLTKKRYDIWHFECLLRKIEYYMNCKHSWFWEQYVLYLKWKFKHASLKMGLSISPNVFGPGLSIAHPGTLIVNGYVRVGENCRIHNCVHLATQVGSENACPKIGNNVFIGPGAVVFGAIDIADGIVIGANSVVNRSFLEKGITIAGVPARKINQAGFDRCYYRSTDILRARSLNSARISVRKSKLYANDRDSNLKLVVKNTGTNTWTKDTLIRIGTMQPKDRPSVYYDPSWIGLNRICSFSENEVQPGEVATFNFTINPVKSVRSEFFQLVMENVSWLPNTQFEISSLKRSYLRRTLDDNLGLLSLNRIKR